MLNIRELSARDAPLVARAFLAHGWQTSEEQFRRDYEQTTRDERAALIAEDEAGIAGYVAIDWVSGYRPFREAGIPEIINFNVPLRCRRRGIGTALMDEAERRVSQRSRAVGIGVGLTADYGAAQILYVRRGYIPDGRGIWQAGHALVHGESALVDDDLCLFLTRRLL